MTKISRAISHLRSAAQTLLDDGPVAEIPDPWAAELEVDETVAVSSAPTGVAGPETALEREQRKSSEYFDVIVRIERERNGWVDMYRTQASEHLTAQSMLERELVAARQTAARALKMLNKMRAEADLDKIVGFDGLVPYDGEPVGLAERYAERMKRLHDDMPALTDGEAERQTISSRP